MTQEEEIRMKFKPFLLSNFSNFNNSTQGLSIERKGGLPGQKDLHAKRPKIFQNRIKILSHSKRPKMDNPF